MSGRQQPQYDLAWVKEQVHAGEFRVPKRVERYLRRKGLPADYPVTCIHLMEAADFHKSQQHTVRKDVWLDVYRPCIGGARWYVKVTVHEDGVSIVVLTCCRDGEAH